MEEDEGTTKAEFLHSEEEIAKLTLPEGLEGLERFDALLSTENPVQAAVAIRMLPNLFENSELDINKGMHVLTKAVAKVPEVLQTGEGAGIVLSFEQLCKMGSFQHLHREFILQAALAILSEMSLRHSLDEEEMRMNFGGILKVVEACMQGIDFSESLVELVSEKASDLNFSVSRILAGNLIGIHCRVFDKAGGLEVQLLQLLSDVEKDVRTVAVLQLSQIIEVDPALFESVFVQRLKELSNDEEIQVLQSYFNQLSCIASKMSKNTLEREVLPFLVEKGPTETISIFWLRAVAKVFEALKGCVAQELDLDGSSIKRAFELFCRRISSEDEEIRAECASSIFFMMKSAGAVNFAKLFDGTFKNLSSDPSPKVRLEIAQNLHDVATFLGRQRSSKLLLDIFIRFLLDVEFREVLVHQIPQLIESMMTESVKLEKLFDPVLDSLVAMSKQSRRWRLASRALISLKKVFEMHIFQDEAFENKVFCDLKVIAKNGAHKIRLQAVEILAMVVSRARDVTSVHDLKAELGRSRCFRSRISFFDFMLCLAKLGFQDLDRVKFEQFLFDLARDTVIDVRYHLFLNLTSLMEFKAIKEEKELRRLLESTEIQANEEGKSKEETSRQHKEGRKSSHFARLPEHTRSGAVRKPQGSQSNRALTSPRNRIHFKHS